MQENTVIKYLTLPIYVLYGKLHTVVLPDIVQNRIFLLILFTSTIVMLAITRYLTDITKERLHYPDWANVRLFRQCKYPLCQE